jgi:CheY-like chemotaxis protein
LRNSAVLLAFAGDNAARVCNEAVALASDRSFDAIPMDGHRPETDGFEATRRIREAEQSSGGHVRIIARTACAYTDKPFNRSRLLAVVETAPDSSEVVRT